MKIIRSRSETFEAELRRLLKRGEPTDETVLRDVEKIVRDVATRGDEALFEYTRHFDDSTLDAGTVRVRPEEIEEALPVIDPADLAALTLSANRIERFHRMQKVESWFTTDDTGTELGQIVRPLQRVGVYAPGGLAPYPSTVLMAAIPARIAGVRELFLVTPARKGVVNPLILAAAHIAGIDRIYRVGGAQAIAALAYGTESIPAVDKIVGPGNIYVATAKRLVFGTVGIDMIAGPSEILIIADGSASPELVAADLLSQAEHDEQASSILLTPDEALAVEVVTEVTRQLKLLSRKSIAAVSLERFGRIIVTGDIDEAVAIANRFAPEHLELMVAEPRKLLDAVVNASAVFLGHNTPEAVGDYMAGPNHILPTAGTARFASPLGVYDFVKRTSLVSLTPRSLEEIGDAAVRFALLEGLDAHASSVKRRLGR
ncbi:MAG: histidinol dehydrogenase [Syntrophales bacterium]|jgi:histidinol dehydrogenase|nr:histidinol dehydrogenase [Syntrophales bacterium]MCK9527522.1 histidinol dehydrogenase [Syntrophales bacterium]MDX9922579.1 histidinol dehydrogenase [Syntrophales bacterium]